MKRVLVDMDEVIADTTAGMIEWYEKTYGGESITRKCWKENHW